MSLPKPIPSAARPPSYSSSPSKSSLRSQKSAVERRSVSSPHFEDNPALLGGSPRQAELAIEEEHVGTGASQVLEEDEEQHGFQPLFTLLHDTQTSEHHHPTVHYIFADDDTDIITEAALRSLADQEDTYTVNEQGEASEACAEAGLEVGKLARSKRRVKEHYILVDVAPTELRKPEETMAAARTNETPSVARPSPLQLTASVATTTNPNAEAHPYPYHITSASSLSPSFAVLSAKITSAPTFDPPSPVLTAKNRRLSTADPQMLGLGIQGQGQAAAISSSSAVSTAAHHENEDRNPSLMLRLEGTSAFEMEGGNDTLATITARGRSLGKDGQKTSTDTVAPVTDREEENMEELVAKFQERLAEIKMVMDAAGGHDTQLPGEPGEEGQAH